MSALARVGLAEAAERSAGSLAYGALKRLEIARALASEPKVLLLDEPAAGCNPVETQDIDRVIRSIVSDGITVVLVEHDMRLVMNISDRVHVLARGKTLAEGTPAASARQRRGDRSLFGRARFAGGRACFPLRTSPALMAASKSCTASRFMVEAGEIVSLIGANGAGKTTLMHAISGVQPITGGAIRFEGAPIENRPAHERVVLGISQVPEGRQVFAPLSVLDNLRLGAWTRAAADLDAALGPRLRAVPHARRDHAYAGRRFVRRPAADARDRPRLDGEAPAAVAGRAVDGAGAQSGRSIAGGDPRAAATTI